MLLEEKYKICEVSESSILPRTQNRKLGYLGKRSVTFNYNLYLKLAKTSRIHIAGYLLKNIATQNIINDC